MMNTGALPQPPRAASLLSFSFLLFMYLFLNTSLNILIKWAIGSYGFRFPLLLTSAHMLFSFCILAPFALRDPWKTHKAILEKQWKGILCIGSFVALNIALNNLSLLDITLSLNQVIRSAIPVVTCVLVMLVENKMPTRREAASLGILSLGVMMAVWQGSVAGKPYAIMICIAGTFCGGAFMTFSSKLLSEKLDIIKLTFYTAPVSVMCLAPFVYMFEIQKFHVYCSTNWHDALLVLLVTSAAALCYNLCHSLTIKRTSAVTVCVLGEIKIVGLLILSALLLGEGKQLTPTMALGFAGALIGFCGYSHAKLEASMIRPDKAALQPGTRPDKAASMEEGALEKEPLKPIKSADGTRGQRIKIVHCTA